MFIWIVSSILLIGNVLPAYWIGTVHQRGSLDVMKPLQQIADQYPHNSSFLFLTPCHATPMYSHLHVNVTTRYLTCLPNLNNIDGYTDEADAFYLNPKNWVRNNYPSNKALPSHIIAFDVLEQFISDLLSRYVFIVNTDCFCINSNDL